jgi:hypothetical protein
VSKLRLEMLTGSDYQDIKDVCLRHVIAMTKVGWIPFTTGEDDKGPHPPIYVIMRSWQLRTVGSRADQGFRQLCC